MKKLSILLLSSLIAVGCSNKNQQDNLAKSKSQNSIINGTPVAADDKLAKSVVGLLAKRGYWASNCTGSVLNQKFILTAAHCLASASDVHNLLINFSLKSLTFEKQSNPLTRVENPETVLTVRKVKSFKIHPEWARTGNHDLAVILLEDVIPTDAIPVTLLPDQFINKSENKTTFDQNQVQVHLIGFGVVSENPPTQPDVLLRTTVPAVFDSQFVVTDQTKGSGGCNGDSGGPAFFDFDGVTYQVGVTHGPHGNSMSCHEQGEWMNPGLDKEFLEAAQAELLAQ